MKIDLIRKYERILKKWRAYKRLRFYEPDLCTLGHVDFLDWRARDKMMEDLLNICEYSKYD